MTTTRASSGTRLRALAATTLMATVGLALPVVTALSGPALATTTTVSAAELLRQDLLQAAAGSTVQLRPGLTGGFALTDLQVRPGVVLHGGSETVSSLSLAGVSGGLSLSHFTVTDRVTISRSTDVTLTRSHLRAGVMVRDGSVRTTVKDNVISGGRNGVHSYSSPGTARQRGLLIEGNDVYGQTGDNVQLGPSDDVVIRDNSLRDLVVSSVHSDGVQAMDVRGLLIAGNRFTNQDEALMLKPEPTIFPGAAITGVVVRDNLVFASRGAGFILVDTTGAQVHNNTFSNNVYADVHLEGQNTDLALRRNVGNRLNVMSGARPAAVQSENCFRYGTLSATDIRTAPQFVDLVRYQLAATSPCRSADGTAWGWSVTSLPGAPTAATATAGDGRATVSWTAPTTDGGSPLTSYTVTATPGGASVSVAASARSATVTGLTNGTAYTFTVKAVNAVGTGPASTASASVTPRAAATTVISESFGSSAANFTRITGGTWSVSNGRYLLSSPASTTAPNSNLSVHNTGLVGDFALTAAGSATATSAAWNDFSVIFGYRDAANYYYASFNESNDSATNGIFKVVGCARTQLADFTSTIAAGTLYPIRIERHGAAIRVSRSGTLLAQVDDSTFTSGLVGFGSKNDGATFDDLTVTGTRLP